MLRGSTLQGFSFVYSSTFQALNFCFHVYSEGQYIFEHFAHETNLMKKCSVGRWSKSPKLVNVVCERPPTERDIKLYVVNHFNDILTYWLGNCYLSAYAKESAVYLLDLDSTEIKASRNKLWCKRIVCFVGFWNFFTCSSWNLVSMLNFHV